MPADIEPDIDIHGRRPELSNITISNCSCINNAGGGLLMNLASLNSSTPPVSIRVENLFVDGNNTHGPGLTIGNVRSVAGTIEIVESRVMNTRGCGIAIYKKEAIQTQVLLDTVSFENVAQGYPLPFRKSMKRACDPTGACNPIFIVGGTDKLNAPEAAMGGISFQGPCVIHDKIDRPFLRADQNAEFALEQVFGSFEVFSQFGCSVMLQKNQTNVSFDTHCHNETILIGQQMNSGANLKIDDWGASASRIETPIRSPSTDSMMPYNCSSCQGSWSLVEPLVVPSLGCKSIQSAVDCAPNSAQLSDGRLAIHLKPGVYREKVSVGATKGPLLIQGLSAAIDDVVISW